MRFILTLILLSPFLLYFHIVYTAFTTNCLPSYLNTNKYEYEKCLKHEKEKQLQELLEELK